MKRFKENNFLTYEIVEEMHIYELSSELESDEENLVDYIYDNFRKNILKQVEKVIKIF